MNTLIRKASSPPQKSFKAAVRSTLSRTFHFNKPSRDLDTTKANDPSCPQSECSTLIEFSTNSAYSNSDLDYASTLEGTNDIVETKNTAERESLTLASKRGAGLPDSLAEGQASDLEDGSRVSPRPLVLTRSFAPNATRRFSLFSCKHETRKGIEPQLLDYENRAWM